MQSSSKLEFETWSEWSIRSCESKVLLHMNEYFVQINKLVITLERFVIELPMATQTKQTRTFIRKFPGNDFRWNGGNISMVCALIY